MNFVLMELAIASICADGSARIVAAGATSRLLSKVLHFWLYFYEMCSISFLSALFSRYLTSTPASLILSFVLSFDNQYAKRRLLFFTKMALQRNPFANCFIRSALKNLKTRHANDL